MCIFCNFSEWRQLIFWFSLLFQEMTQDKRKEHVYHLSYRTETWTKNGELGSIRMKRKCYQSASTLLLLVTFHANCPVQNPTKQLRFCFERNDLVDYFVMFFILISLFHYSGWSFFALFYNFVFYLPPPHQISDRDVDKKWGAWIRKNEEKMLSVRINTPPTCYVGVWKLQVETIKKADNKNIIFEYTIR
jgi:hypothetical protein